MSNQDIIETLVSLARLDFDLMCAYEETMRRLDRNDKDVRDNLILYRNDHALHVNGLSTAIMDFGGQVPPLSPESRGRTTEGIIDLTGIKGTVDALTALRQNELLANRIYADMIAGPVFSSFSEDFQEHLKNNYADEQHHLAYVESVLNSLTLAAR